MLVDYTMKNQQPNDIMYKKVAWTIKNFSKLKTEYLYSEVFTFRDTAWKVLLYPEGYDDHLSIFLQVADDISLPEGWSIYAEFSLAVVNQNPGKMPEKFDFKCQFSDKSYTVGFPDFMPLGTLHDPHSGFLLNNTCIIEVEWIILKPKGIRKDLFEEYGFIDFRGLGPLERDFIPVLLEEVCLWHPSLVECQKKRTRKFTEWAFIALGRVLHFLKTKNGHDMIVSEYASEHLKNLWEELKTFGFDLTWLEPHVKSALGMKKAYMEKAEQVKKLKENLVAYETEIEKLREKLANAEENAEKVRIDLAKAEEGFEEKDMHAEFGYGKGKL